MRPGVAAVVLAALAVSSAASSRPATVPFVVQLKLDSARIDRDLAAGRRIASPAALGARYGLPPTEIRRVERVLETHGIEVVGSYPQRTAIDVRATPATVSGFLHHLPGELAPYVAGIVGPSTRPVALPADLPHGALLPEDAILAYDVDRLRNAGIDGTGQTIAVLSLSPFPPNGGDTSDDVSTFRDKFAPRGPAPVDVEVDGGGTVKDVSEDDLDVDVVSAIAPGAQIVNYEAPPTAAGVVDMFQRLVADGKASIASFSWGVCDAGLPSAYRSGVSSALKLAVLRGITVFVASGDGGSYDCQRANFADHRLTVDFPASCPQAVAVGGTLLAVSTDGSYGGEAGWEQPLSYAGGGGGVDPNDPAPSWQAAAGVRGGHRGVPDVSAAASPDSGWVIRDYGNWGAAGGTSAAAPFWAASMLLAHQFALKQGVRRRCFLTPILYRLATTHQRYPAFHDVKAGGNRYYDAGPGWDYATGLGSPDVWNLTRDLTAYLRSNPCPPGT
jgi:subtilase family serine protease